MRSYIRSEDTQLKRIRCVTAERAMPQRNPHFDGRALADFADTFPP